jgi:hypothetical protein
MTLGLVPLGSNFEVEVTLRLTVSQSGSQYVLVSSDGGFIPSTQRYYRRLFLLLNTT